MNIALIGYGKMGHEISEMAFRRGHNVQLIIDIDNRHDFIPEKFSGIDVVIEFTSPESAFENVKRCLEMRKPVVSGSTGWLTRYEEAADICRRSGTAFIHASNFSIGVNILFRLNSALARMMSNHSEYSVSIEEIHHTKKLDAPSGTAISLSEGIVSSHPGYTGWKKPEESNESAIPVRSVREGMVPGTHTVEWDSEVDTITIRHEAKGRKGFALGAVLAAEFITARTGVFTMKDVLGF